MDVVGEDFKLVDEPPIHLRTLNHEVCQTSDHVLPENLTAILGAKDDVVATFVEGMRTLPEQRFVRFRHLLSLAQWDF